MFISGTWLALAAAGAGDDAAAVIEVGSSKQLFIDDRFIESSRDVELVMNPPRRDGKVLLTTDQPWEAGRHVSVYSSVIRENGLTKVWYDFREPTQGGPDTYKFRVCYAESESGLQFIKPQLDLFEVDGSTANSVVSRVRLAAARSGSIPRRPPSIDTRTRRKSTLAASCTCTVLRTGYTGSCLPRSILVRVGTTRRRLFFGTRAAGGM